MGPEELEEILAILRSTSERLRQLTAGLPNEAYTWKPSADRWSMTENVCHLRDIEHEGYNVRIQRIATEDTPILPDIEGTQLAIDRKYNEQNLDQAIAAFDTARAKNIELITGYPEATLSRIGTFEDFGDMTLAGLLEIMVEHDHGHVSDIEKLVKGFAATR
jgi:DinB family.